MVVPWLSEDPITGTIAADDFQVIDINFDTTALTQSGDYIATLLVNNNDPENDVRSIPISMTVINPLNYSMTLSPDLAAVGSPASTVTYTLEITNTGSISDVYDLSISGNTWPATSFTETVGLDPGQSVAISVFVEIPFLTPNGAMDVATITATSQGDGGISDSADLTTTVVGLEHILFIPVTVKNAP